MPADDNSNDNVIAHDPSVISGLETQSSDIQRMQFELDRQKFQLASDQFEFDKRMREREMRIKEKEADDAAKDAHVERLLKERETKLRTRWWNLLEKAGLPFATIAGAVFALAQFGIGLKQTATTRRMETNLTARKYILDAQSRTYQKVIQVSGKLVILQNDPSKQEAFLAAINEFEELYWSEMPLIESDDVCAKMDAFKTTIESKSSTSEAVQYAEFKLALSIRTSLRQSIDLTVDHPSNDLMSDNDLKVRTTPAQSKSFVQDTGISGAVH